MIRPLRVLFVDDDPVDVELERAALRRDFQVEGRRIETADDFAKALSAGGFEIILCDYSMPRFSGMHALSMWQAAGLNVPFIFVTGRLSEEVAVDCIKAGATDYVLKANLARLTTAVGRALREFAAACALRLAEAERTRIMAAVEQAAEAVAIGDRDGNILYINPAFTSLTGYELPDVSARDMLRQAGQGTPLYDEIRRVLGNCEVWRGQVTVRRRDGSAYDAEATVAPVLDAAGEIVNVCAIHRDVSERVAGERRLRELNARLAETDRMKDEFLAAFSHELRTPLNIIMGYSDILADTLRGQIDAESHRFLEAIVRSATHLAGLLTETLDLARLRIDAMQPQFAPTDVGALVQEVAEGFKSLAAAKRLSLGSTIAPGTISAITDALRLRQVLHNLIDNAVKFTEQGRVDVSVRYSGDVIVMEVSDTGIGVAAADVPRMFEDFRQLDGSMTRRYEGCGLGLALTKRLLALLGGRIEVESSLGHGSCFRVYLPTTPPHVDGVSPAAKVGGSG